MVVNAFFFFFHDLIWLYGEIRGGFGNKTVLWKLFVWLRFGDMCGIKKKEKKLISCEGRNWIAIYSPLSSDTTQSNRPESVVAMKWNSYSYFAFLRAGKEDFFFPKL